MGLDDGIHPFSGLPMAILAVMLALIPAGPEFMAAITAARHDRMQTTVISHRAHRSPLCS